jgi:serine protease Do
MISKSIPASVFAAVLCSAAALGAQPAPDPPFPALPPMAYAEEAERAVRVFVGGGGSFLGVDVVEIDGDRARALKLKEERGVEITRVADDSPASKAGLLKGDVVLEFNGQRVEGTEQFVRLVRETPAGRQVKLSIRRGGAEQTITATVGSRKTKAYGGAVVMPRFHVPEFEVVVPDTPSPMMSWKSGMLGIVAEPVENQLAEFFGVKEGVLVRSVNKASAAEKAGIKAGDVITKVDSTKVDSPREITSAIRSRKNNTFPVTLVRERKEMTLSVTVEEKRSEHDIRQRSRSVRVGPSEKL